ncbi:hypothetical protein HanRHA438_Chr14g0681641 [Helianthus annuus]|uniref:Uncharacterized protein n=1 Tax=Helianthus annuus TaxID=4232 RepID=A0A9K3ED54_HELAN|nr:hypothetical protein HanXRQr2_Chr14g0669761 [Helianthus annuus]KAJ0466212.1 hypothetical protein HanHA300_Chr14g0546621 [Helianthus annuus]KAJ0487775.1 hypothetical protein HanHA89_Chr14g0594091 [Helianthus annuus]KAJ0658238.1 hypothetical protein HanLR1_Chr14g0555511 [Helianthus annuus]KAJ0661912.1 hypothetical protein HanOQP8_Chr14g0553701 [Helianthus annuus]
MSLLKYYVIHFSQLHPLAFLRIVHFELSCVAFASEPSVPRFSQLRSDGDWFTFKKGRTTFLSLAIPLCQPPHIPCYSFVPTSTYPKKWKNSFIFVYSSMLFEPLSIRYHAAAIKDGVPPLSSTEDVMWRHMYEHSTRASNFLEDIVEMGGLSHFYPTRPRAFYNGKVFGLLRTEMFLWRLLQADCRGVSYVVEVVVNQEMCGVLGGGAPDVEGLNAELVPGEGTPPLEGASPKGSEGSQNSPQVENASSDDEDLATWLSRKRKPDLTIGTIEVVPEVRNIHSRLRSASSTKSQPASQTISEALRLIQKAPCPNT